MKLICQLIKNQNQPSLLSEIGSVILCIAAALSTAEAQTDAFELQPALPAISTTLVDPAVIENADKGDAALRLQLLETYEELYNWPMTKALAEMILHKDGAENAPALSAVTNAYLRMKDGDRALQAATRLVKIIDSPETQALQAQALILLGRHSEAAAVFRKVKSAGKKDALFQWQEELAFALFNAGKNKESRKAFQEILDQKDYSSRLKATAKKQVRLMQALDAQHWMHEGENDKAVAILEKLKRSGEGTFEFQEDLAFAYQNAGKLDEARKAFESITRSAGYDARAKSNARDQINLLDSLQAEYLKDQGDYEQALSLLNNLKKRFRNAIFPFQDQLAYTLVDSGEVESAREAFQEIVSNKAYPADQRNTARLEIQSIEVGNLITKGYAALEGRVNWRQARQVDALLMNRHSTHPDAIAFHASILSLSGRCDKAIQVLEQLRDAQFKDKQFPHAGLLAECYYQ
ncbi:MAG: tetratricopeptide (TPR) repeat protein, partial [Verrucomicrobiales bacterium]